MKKNIIPHYSRVLKKLRQGKSLTQTQLSKLLEIPREKISWMETGKMKIPDKYKTILANFFATTERVFH